MLTETLGTKDRLLRSALTIVARDGMAAATTAAIAAETGVAEGTLYRHFPSKDDLLIEAYRRLKGEVFDAFTAAGDAEGPPEERLKALWLTLINAYRSDTAAFNFGQRFAESALSEREGGAAHERIGAALARLRDAGVASGVFKDLPIDILSNLFFGPVGYMVKSEIKGRRWTDAELDMAASAVVDGWRA